MTGSSVPDQQATGRDLDRAIAEAMGWTVEWIEIPRLYRDGVRGDWYSRRASLPHWHSSLDALRHGPEKVLREAGCYFDAKVGAPYLHGWQRITWFGKRGDALTELDALYDGGEAEARARVALAALKALPPLHDQVEHEGERR